MNKTHAGGVLFEKPTRKKFLAYYGTKRLIIVFTLSYQLSKS
jgi:hypothetical protein